MNIIRREKNSNLKRLNEIIKVFSKYEFDYILEKIGLKQKIPFIKRSFKYELMEEMDDSLPID